MTPRAAVDRLTLERGYVRRKLATNLRRRQRAAHELATARTELAELLARGVKVGLTITEMAAISGVRREHVRRRILDKSTKPRFMNKEVSDE